MVVYLYFIGNSDNTWYVIFFISIMTIATVELLCTVLYYLYNSYLYKNKHIANMM